MFGFGYIPLIQSKYYDNNSFDQLEKDTNNFQNSGYSVVLLGDFNAGTKSLIDYVGTDEDFIERLGLDGNILSTTADKNNLRVVFTREGMVYKYIRPMLKRKPS